MGDVTKSFLYAWCGKNKVTPKYEVRLSGLKPPHQFFCKVTVRGFDHVGVGEATRKKEAQTIAARDFLLYLIRIGKLQPSAVPKSIPLDQISKPQSSSNLTAGDPLPIPPDLQSRSESLDYPMKDECLPHQGSNPSEDSDFIADEPNIEKLAQVTDSSNSLSNEFSAPDLQMTSEKEKHLPHQQGAPSEDSNRIEKNAEKAEDSDDKPELHGNWTIDSAKFRLFTFCRKQKMYPDFNYTYVGLNNNRNILCELSIPVEKLGKSVSARDYGVNKYAASRACALSLVRQLYHLQVIDAYNKKEANEKISYEVNIDPKLIAEVENLLKTLDIKPVEIPDDLDPNEPFSVLIERDIETDSMSCSDTNNVVPWSPPQKKWNPWTRSNIDEGPFAASMESISQDLKDRYEYSMLKDKKPKKVKELQQLPISEFKEKILSEIQNNSVVIIRGETGCGKTTQVPQYILDSEISQGYGADCCIVVTQPRCINAISADARVAEERSEQKVRESVGYSVRFESSLPRPYGSILFCTVGVLLRMMEGGLRGVSHIIVDEIQERDANSDFVMVVLRDMVKAFPQLRVILMSSTIDTSLFQEYFGNCPVIEVSGRTFPVKHYFLEDCVEIVNYLPPPGRKWEDNIEEVDDTVSFCGNMNKIIGKEYTEQTRQTMAAFRETELHFEFIEALLCYIKSLDRPGAVLIFLPGWRSVSLLKRHLETHFIFGTPKFCILTLYEELPQEELTKLFVPFSESVTKIILATSIAESSITISDVVHVIDTCKVKTKLFTSHNNVTHYVTDWASKSNLEQRRGRAGRVRHGFAFHLCSKARFEKLENTAPPQILRTPLHEIALAIKLLRLGDISKFLSKALKPPSIDAVIESEVLLREIGALDDRNELTHLGKLLARLPVEPRIGKMLILGCIFSCGDSLCTIAADSSTFADLFDKEVPDRLSNAYRKLHCNRWSDHMTVLDTFFRWELSHYVKKKRKEKNFCERFSLNSAALNATSAVRKRLVELLCREGFPESSLECQTYDFDKADSNLDVVSALLVVGLYPKVCFHKRNRDVAMADGRGHIHITSVNCTKNPVQFPSPFFVFDEKVQSRVALCKQMNMVTPIHLLLFGCREVNILKGMVEIDGWINLIMSPRDASMLVALQPVIEELIMQVAANPGSLIKPSPKNLHIIKVISKVCVMDAGKFDTDRYNSSGTSRDDGPRAKKARISGGTLRGDS